MNEKQFAIVANNIHKSYGETYALNDVSIKAEKGKVTALLGPNGSGKTTLVRILATLLRADSGTASVAGFDVQNQASYVRSVVGLTGQFAAVDGLLTGFENLVMVGELYHLSKPEAKERATELLSQFSLSDAANRRAATYSGGMRRRLDLAASLIVRPPVVILDEPTTGLDPRTRIEMWEAVEQLVEIGISVLLTTQYLEEADRLANKIVVLDRGKVIAEGTADELKNKIGGDVVEFIVQNSEDFERSIQAMSSISEVEPITNKVQSRVSIPAADGAQSLMQTLRKLDDENIPITDIGLRRPSLDDVFLSLTGHVAQEESASVNPRMKKSRSSK